MATSEQNTLRVAALGLVAALCLFIFLCGQGIREEKERVGEDGCFLNRESDTAQVILIDTSDRLPDLQASLLKSELELIINDAKRGDIVAIYALTRDSLEPIKPLERQCSPGPDPNFWIEGEQDWEDRRQRFFDAIDKALEGELENGGLPRSPILEAFIAIDARELRSRDRSSNRLVVASDLLQYSDALSHFETPLLPFKRFKKTAQYSALRPDLKGTSVQLLYLHRERYHHLQSPEHIIWWRDYIAHNDGEFGDPFAKKIRGDFE